MLSSGPGFSILKKMGWDEGKSLGKRGDGILKPVEVEVSGIRMRGNTRGLGFGKENPAEKVRPPPGDTVIALINIYAAGDNYGAGSSFFGRTYIPGGVMRHISNLTRLSKYGLIGKKVRVLLVGSEEDAKYPWRVVRCI
jgi:hypothetical protein